ncbi:MAG: DUF2164 domain-containing protein [Eubacteriales bacterium]
MHNKDSIKLSKEKKQDMVHAIKSYFLKEREEELGDLASSLILDFFIEELAPEIYNQGIYDAYYFLNDKLEDLLSIQKY